MKKISRRSFLKVAGIGAAALGLAACGGSSASTTTSTASSTAASAGGSDAGFTNTTLTLYSPGGENSWTACPGYPSHHLQSTAWPA